MVSSIVAILAMISLIAAAIGAVVHIVNLVGVHWGELGINIASLLDYTKQLYNDVLHFFSTIRTYADSYLLVPAGVDIRLGWLIYFMVALAGVSVFMWFYSKILKGVKGH